VRNALSSPSICALMSAVLSFVWQRSCECSVEFSILQICPFLCVPRQRSFRALRFIPCLWHCIHTMVVMSRDNCAMRSCCFVTAAQQLQGAFTCFLWHL
jgi:hypothetical protein